MSNTNGRKVGDFKSVDVTIADGVTVAQGEWVLAEGFFGLAAFDDKPVALGAAQISIDIDQAEYETDQITIADAFNKGDLVNFNSTTKLFTTQAVAGAIIGPVGRVSVAKDVNNVIWFSLFQQRR
jgi:hypothetical protein